MAKCSMMDNDKLCDEYVIFKRKATTICIGGDVLDISGRDNYKDVWKEKLQCSSFETCEALVN